MSVRDDQSWGGAVLAGLGDIAGVPFLIALIAQGVREERARIALVDRELDAQEHETPRRQDGVEPGESAWQYSSSVVETRLWWETDPRFAGRYNP